MKQSCRSDNGDSCDNFEFSYHDLKAIENKLNDKSHWIDSCAEFNENNRMSSVPDGPTEFDLFKVSSAIALFEYLKNMPMNPKLLKFYRKASFVLGVPNSDARSPGSVFCIGSLEESLKGSLASAKEKLAIV